MKNYVKHDAVKYIIMFLIATAIGFVFTRATAQTVSGTGELSAKSYYEQLEALSERQIEVEEKDGKTNFRVLDCDGGIFRIYNIVGKLVFSRKIEGEVWLCSVPLTQGVYIIGAGKYGRRFEMLGEKDIDNSKNEPKCK